MKRTLCLLLTVILTLGLVLPAAAAEFPLNQLCACILAALKYIKAGFFIGHFGE